MNKEHLDPEWGYSEKDGNFRPLTEEEHQLLVEQRQEEAEELKGMIEHTQETVKLFKDGDPEIKAHEIVMVILKNGRDSYNEIEAWVGGFDGFRKRFHIGNPLQDGWLVTVSDAVELQSKFPEHIRLPEESDIQKQLLRTVSPDDLDPSNIEAWFKK